MRLRTGKISYKKVLIPTRRYVRMVNPQNMNTNEERTSDSTTGGTVSAPSTGENASITSTMNARSIMQDGVIIPLSIVLSIPIIPGVTQSTASDFRLYVPSLTLFMFTQEQPYGMSTMMMESLNLNMIIKNNLMLILIWHQGLL